MRVKIEYIGKDNSKNFKVRGEVPIDELIKRFELFRDSHAKDTESSEAFGGSGQKTGEKEGVGEEANKNGI